LVSYALGKGVFRILLPAKLLFLLLALCFWILACPASQSDDDEFNLHNQQVQTLFKQGKYQEAIPLVGKAVELAKRVYGPEHPNTATSLYNLGSLYQSMGEYAKAKPLSQEALRILQKVLGSEHPDTASSLNNLAELYDDMGECVKAEPLYQEALPIQLKVLGPEHPDTTTSLNNLAALYWAIGEYAKAEPLFQEGIRICQKALGPEHPDTATMFENLALLEFDLGRIDEATALARQASAAELKILSKIFSFTSEQQRLAYLDIFHPYGLFPFLKGSEADLAAAVLRYKGIVLDSIVEERLLAEASQGSEDQKLVEQLDLDKRQLGQLLLQPAQKLSAQTNRRTVALEGEVEKIESQLAQHVAGLGQARHALGMRLEQVQPTIPNAGALIEYLRYWHYSGKRKWEPRYGAIVSLSEGAPLWIPLGKAKEIEHLVRRYGTLVKGSPLVRSFRRQTILTPGGNSENALTTYPSRIGNQLCFADLCPTDKHTRSTTT
jgi:tetratricopeptide (TPR) repeat protein